MSFFNLKFLFTDLGFDSVSDWFTSITGFKNNILAPFSFITGATIAAFIQNNIWASPEQVYFLAILVAIDLFTGIWKSIKFNDDPIKKFRSRKISRTVGKLITYSLVLYVAFNLDKNMHAPFFWMPYSCLGVFYATESWSIIENLSELGYLNHELVAFLKDKLNIFNYFSLRKTIKTKKDHKDKKLK